MEIFSARLSNLVIHKLDLPFTLGRVFGLMPVLIMSRVITETDPLAEQVSNYQIALFLATLVLYGAPQVYLVKQGLEQRVFVYHLLISSVIVLLVLSVLAVMGCATGVMLPFAFLVFFRSYYLLYASYLKMAKGRQSLYLVGIALVTLSFFAVTLNFFMATLACAVLTAGFTIYLGYAKLRYAVAAARAYFRILRANAGYFTTYLFQQTYTQIALAVYAFIESGTQYLLATHMVYIYSLCFIFHSMLFRFYLSKMSRQKDISVLRTSLKQSLKYSMILGIASTVTVILGYKWIEYLLFAKSFLTLPTAVMLGMMILLNAINGGWSPLFLALRRPYELTLISSGSTLIVILGILALHKLEIENPLIYAMLLGLAFQAIFRSFLGLKLLKQH